MQKYHQLKIKFLASLAFLITLLPLNAENGCFTKVIPAKTGQNTGVSPRLLPEQLKSRSVATGYGLEEGFLKFNLSAPVSWEKTLDFKDMILAGCNISADKMIGVTFSYGSNGEMMLGDVIKVDLKNGNKEIVSSLPEGSPTFLDMTYDSKNDIVYALVAERGSSLPSLGIMDKNTGKLTLLTRFEKVLYSLACDSDGRLFLVERSSGELWVMINPLDGKRPARVGGGNVEGAAYISSMAMDQASYTLYWAMSAKDMKCYLVSINPISGLATKIGTLGTSTNTREITAMDIASPVYNNSVPTAPRNLQFIVNEDGELKAVVKWQNHVSMNTSGGKSILAVYLNGAKIKEYENVAEGAEMTLEIPSIRSGYNHIRVVAENSVGEGVPADSYVWGGKDVPRAVTDIKLVRNGSTANLSWNAPIESVHGGYMNPSNIKYRVVRYGSEGDSVILQKTLRQTSLTDEIEVADRYYYTVQALSTDYGETASSEAIYLGKAISVPFATTFNDKRSFALWTPVDGDGNGNTWVNRTISPYYVYNRRIDKNEDDVLVSPPISLVAGKSYTLSFEVPSLLGEFYPKTLEIIFGKSAVPSSMERVVLKEFSVKGTERVFVTLNATESGEYYFGFRDLSEPTTSNLCISNLRLEEKNSGAIEGYVRDEHGNPIAGATVTVIEAALSVETGEDGNYFIDYVPSGSYTVTAKKYRYRDFTVNGSVNVTKNNVSKCDIVLNKKPVYKVSGRLLDADSGPVSGVTVKFTNSAESIRVVSDDKGEYSLPEMVEELYTYEISKLKYKAVRGSMQLRADSVFSPEMEPSLLPPANFKGKVVTGGVSLSWRKPMALFRRDNGGKPIGQGGAVVGDDYYLFGTVWQQPASISAISWMTTEYRGPHNEMNLWLLDITDKGVPTNKVLFNAMHVPSNGDLKWTRYELPETVDCPNGFYLAVSYTNGMASLATSDGTDVEWPFVPYVNYRSADYRTNEWVCMDASFVKNNYMIRAEGEGIGTPGDEFDYRYDLYRLRPGEEEDEAKWIRLSPDGGMRDTDFTDPSAPLEKGDYKYAIRARYPKGKFSDTMFTDNLSVDHSEISEILTSAFECIYNSEHREVVFTSPADSATLTDLSGIVRVNKHNTDKIDISGLSSGIYILKANSDSKYITRKIIIK